MCDDDQQQAQAVGWWINEVRRWERKKVVVAQEVFKKEQSRALYMVKSFCSMQLLLLSLGRSFLMAGFHKPYYQILTFYQILISVLNRICRSLEEDGSKILLWIH